MAIRSSSCSCVLIVLCLAGPTSVAHAGWVSETVEHGVAPLASSLVLSPSGLPSVAYGEGEVYFATFDGAVWSRVRVGTQVCDGVSSLAYDGNGVPAVAFRAAGTEDLRLARPQGGTWMTEVIDPEGSSPSLAVDPLGRLGVAYLAGPEVRYAWWDGAAWVIELVERWEFGVDAPSLAFALGDGEPAIAYQGLLDPGYGVSLFRRKAGVWSGEGGLGIGVGVSPPSAAAVPGGNKIAVAVVDSTGLVVTGFPGSIDPLASRETRPALGFDASGAPRVAYTALDGSLRCARFTGSGWTTEPIVTKGSRPSLAVGAGGELWVSHDEPMSGTFSERLYLGLQAGAFGWGISAIERGSLSYFPSLALDPAGLPAIATTDASVYFHRFDGTNWRSEPVAPGIQPSLAYDASGLPVIAYTESWDLRFARFDGARWNIESLTGGSIVYLDLAMDLDGNPAIAYFDFSTYRLELARFDGTRWITEVADAVGTPALGLSLAFDRAGQPAISYLVMDQSKYWIYLARRDGAAWTRQLIEPVPRSESTALAFDAIGSPLVAYCTDVVSLARGNGPGFDYERIPAACSAVAVDLVLDLAGSPVIAYTSIASDPYVTEVARRGAGGWSSEPVAGSRGFPSLAVKADGGLLVATVDGHCPGNLYLAREIVVSVYRAAADLAAPDWKEVHLPLDSSNDEVGGSFPFVSGSPGTIIDSLPATGGLVLYRFLLPGNQPDPNQLRATKVAAGVKLEF